MGLWPIKRGCSLFYAPNPTSLVGPVVRLWCVLCCKFLFEWRNSSKFKVLDLNTFDISVNVMNEFKSLYIYQSFKNHQKYACSHCGDHSTGGCLFLTGAWVHHLSLLILYSVYDIGDGSLYITVFTPIFSFQLKKGTI